MSLVQPPPPLIPPRQDEPLFATPTGWLCPQCGKVNAPAVLQCPCEPKTVTTKHAAIPVLHPMTTDPVMRDPAIREKEFDRDIKAVFGA